MEAANVMRLFAALENSEETKRLLALPSGGLRSAGFDLRFSPEEQLHLTLKFLGHLEAERVPEVQDVLQRCASATAAFEFEICGAGCFPPHGPVRVVWAGVRSGADAITDLAVRLDEALSTLGVERESRLFHPHVTLARVKEDRSAGALREAVAKLEIPSIVQPSRSITLFESQLTPQGSKYSAVSRHAFR